MSMRYEHPSTLTTDFLCIASQNTPTTHIFVGTTLETRKRWHKCKVVRGEQRSKKMRAAQQIPTRFTAYVDYLKGVAKEAHNRSPMLFGYPLNCKQVDFLNKVHEAMPQYAVLNNCLDPFAPEKSHFKIHTMKQERDLVVELATPWVNPQTPVWGYVTTGGTEGNLKGLRTGLERSPKKKLVVFSEDAHFSVEKAARISGEQFVKIKSRANGQMDLADLSKVIDIGKRAGAEQLVVLATLGTTFKGACDDIPSILEHAQEFYSRGNIFLHLDAAFTGGFWQHDETSPKYVLGDDFDSFSVSGHKFYGGFIAGCFFTSESTFIKATPVGYLGLEDKITSGSRNGHLPIMWMARLRQFDWAEEYRAARSNLEYMQKKLADQGIKSFAHPISLIAIFPEPSNAVCDYFQLATLNDWAHVCMMPHISRDEIDIFIDTLVKNGDAEKMRSRVFETDPTGWPITNE